MDSTRKRGAEQRGSTFVADDLKELLDSPIAFHRILAHVGGGPLEGLFLSQALYWTPRATHTDEILKASDGWFFKTQADWWKETALSRKNQETARRNLKRLGVLEEQRHGIPAQLYFRVNLERLAELLRETLDNRKAEQARMPETGKQDSPKRANRTARNGQPIRTENTAKNTSETTSSGDDDEFETSSLVSRLVAAGASPARAKRAAAANAPEMEQRLKYLEHFEPNNPGAWLTTTPEVTFTPPKEILAAQRDEARAASSRAEARAAADRRRGEAEAQAAAQEDNARLDSTIEAMEDFEREQLEESARHRVGAAPAFAAAGVGFEAALRAEMRNILRSKEGE